MLYSCTHATVGVKGLMAAKHCQTEHSWRTHSWLRCCQTDRCTLPTQQSTATRGHVSVPWLPSSPESSPRLAVHRRTPSAELPTAWCQESPESTNNTVVVQNLVQLEIITTLWDKDNGGKTADYAEIIG